jgi:hypothetical protein
LLNFNPQKQDVWWIALMPRGWIDQNKLRINEWYDRLLAESDPPAQRMHLPGETLQISLMHPYTFIYSMYVRFLGGNDQIAEASQAEVNLFRIALALRRYCLRNGHYPGQLAELTPDYLPQLPAPTGKETTQPAYQRTTDGATLGPHHWLLRIPALKPAA